MQIYADFYFIIEKEYNFKQNFWLFEDEDENYKENFINYVKNSEEYKFIRSNQPKIKEYNVGISET